MKILSVDIGTSGVRSAIYDENLECLATSSVKTKLYRSSNGIVETDPDEIFDNFLKTAKDVIKCVKEKTDISDLCLLSYSVQGEAIIAIDKNNSPISLAPVSMDERAKHVVEEFASEMSTDEYRQITGQPLHPMFSIFKIVATRRWHNMEEGSLFLSVDGYVSTKLGANPYIDITSAARFGMLNADTGEWDKYLLKRFKINESFLPNIVYPGQCVGKMASYWKKELGLDASIEVKITAGAHDQACAFWGSGGTCEGKVTYSLGSTDCFTQGSRKRPDLPKGSGLATYRAFENLWITLAGTAASGWSLEWLDKILNDKDEINVGAMVDDMSSEPTNILVLPYHAGSGTLDNNPNARGIILGLGLNTTRGDIIRAFFEASGYEVAKIVEATKNVFAPIESVNAVGGGASDNAVMQLRADSSNLVLSRIGYDAALRGAAIQALVGCGVLSDYTQAPLPKIQSKINPRSEYVEHYENQRKKYISVYAALEGKE